MNLCSAMQRSGTGPLDGRRTLIGRTPDRSPTVWEQIGGISGLLQSAIPSLVFVSVQSVVGIAAAGAVSIAAAVAILVARWMRGLTLRPAIGGLVGVVISSSIACGTGAARDYFLPDIWGYAVGAVVLAASIVARWPLAGVVWSAMNGTTMRWRQNRKALTGYSIATAAAAAVFLVRAVTQLWLYRHDEAGAMVLARVVVNYPLWAIAGLTWAWSIRRARDRHP